jgi:hypothetical protein
MLTKIVAKKKDGTLIKGMTSDFFPNKSVFHVNMSGPGNLLVEVPVNDLKAVFFVKDLEGRKSPHSRPSQTEKSGQSIEKAIRVFFKDNEVIDGYSHSLHFDRTGFFMTPSDPNDNNERIFVVLSSVTNVIADGKAIDLTSGGRTGKTCEVCGKLLDLSWKFCPFDGTKIP